MKTKMMIFGGMMLAMMAQVWALTSSPVRVDTRTTYGRYLATGVELVGEPDGSSISNWDTTEFSAIEGDGWNRLTSSDGSRISVRVINESAVVHGGRLAVSEIWSADKVHVVRSNVVVPDGVTLTLETDAVVKFVPGASIATEGTGSLVVRGARCADIADDSVGGDTDMNETDDGEMYGDYEQYYTTPSDWFEGTARLVEMIFQFSDISTGSDRFTRYYTRGEKIGDLPQPEITETPLSKYMGWIVYGTSDSPEYITSSTLAQDGMFEMYYQEIVSHTVTFDLGAYGTHTGGGELVQLVRDGELAIVPNFEVADDWSFTGWDKDVTDPITADTVFVARYEEVIREPEAMPDREVTIDVDEIFSTDDCYLTLTVTAGETVRFNYDLDDIDECFFGSQGPYSFVVSDGEGDLLEEFDAYNGFVDWKVSSEYQGTYYVGVYPSDWIYGNMIDVGSWSMCLCGYKVTVVQSEVEDPEDTTPTFDSRVEDMLLCEPEWNDTVVYSAERLRFWLDSHLYLNGVDLTGYKALVLDENLRLVRYLDIADLNGDYYVDWDVSEAEGRYWVGFVAESEIKSGGRGSNRYYYVNTVDSRIGAYFNVSAGTAEGLYTVRFRDYLPRFGGGALIQRVSPGGSAEEPVLAAGPVDIDGVECYWQGWDSYAWMNVTSDMTINAIYAPETVEPATYTVTVDGAATEYEDGTEVTFHAPSPKISPDGGTQTVYLGTTYYQPTTNVFTVVVTNSFSFNWDIVSINYMLNVAQPLRGGSISGAESGWQSPDAMLMLTRKVDAGYHLVGNGWTGDVDGLYQWGDSLAVVMDMPRTIGLAVEPDAYAITYADTRGAANPNPATYTIEDEVVFAPLPDVTGWKFIGWSQAYIPAGSMGAVTVTAQWVPAECSVTIGGEETKVTWGSEVTFCAPEPFVDELCKTQIVYVGTTFTDPVVTNEFTVTVTNDIDFTWDILATNYWFETAQTQNGMIEAPEAGWKPYEETFLISAIPTNHYHFVTWTGDTEGCVATNGNGLVVTMDRARSIGVEFAIDTFTVLFKAGAHGSLSGKTVQTVAYGGNAEVPSVDSHVGYRFVGWSGDVTAPVTGNRTFEARYSAISYNIAYTELKGAANPNPATYTVEDEIVFAPLPDVEGWNFVGWSPSSIAKDSTGAKTVVAQWERVLHSVNVGGVSTNVIYGTEITFRAPAPFVDELCKTQIVCVGTTFTDPVVTNEFTVTVTNDIDFTWNIFATNYWLEVESAELGVIDGVTNGWLAAGSVVALTAVADAGCRHYRWLGDISGCAADGNVLGVVMDRARTIGARFAYDVRAVIDSVSPQNPTEDSHIVLQGHGEGGVVTEHHWKAVNLSDGSVSELSRAQACRVRFGVGEWRLEYRVKDSTGIWSDPATMSVTVTGMEQVIDLQVCRTGVTFIDSIGLPTSNVQTGDVVAVRVKVQNRGNTHMSEGATVYLCDGILPVDEMTDLTGDDPHVLASGRISRLNIGRSQTVSMTWNVGKTNSGSVRTYDEGPNAFTVAVVPDSESDVETVIDNNLVTTMLEVGESDVPLAEIFNISAKYEEKVFGGADYSVSGKVWYERDGVKVYVAGATLTFIVDGEVAGSCETDDSGNYVWMFAAPDKGEHTISVKAMDGNVVKAVEGSFVSEERPSTGGGSGGDEENPDHPEEPVPSVKTANLKVLSFICTGDGITDRNGNVYSASLGGEVTFDAVVRNAGQIAVTNAFSVKITDNTNGDILAYAVSTNGLAVGEELSVSLDEPFVLENAGRYGYRITVDEEGLVDESSETDNESKVWITVEEPLPNLIVTDMTFSDTQPLEGEELVVRAKVRNVGDVPCPAGVRVVLNANGSMSEMVMSDELAVDASADVVYSIIPAEGILRMFIEADCLDEIAESDETDNRLSRTLAIYSVNADVKPVSLVADPYPKAGEPCVLTAVFRNDGGASYQGGTAVFFVDDPDSGKIAEVAVGPIAWKGGVGNATCVWTPDANADRIIGVMIDGKVYSATYSATPPPDLRVTAEDISFEPGTPSGGDTVKFRAMVRNVSGSVSAENATVLFEVASADGDFAHLTTMTVPLLTSGGSVAVDADIPYTVVRGIYKVKVSVLDGSGRDARSADNMAERKFGVDVPVAVTGGNLSCIAGDTVTLDGSASTDATQWFWSLVEAPVGNEASVVDASASVTTFTPQIAGLYRFELVVSDGIQESESTECTVLVDRVRVTASASYGGVIDPAGEQVQLAGSAPVYAATEARGYSFNCFRLDGVCVTNEHSAYTFAPLDRNHEIEACFSVVAYPVAYAETKGAMNGNPTTYTVEDEIVFAALPDVEGWRFTGWQPASIEKGTIGSMTVTAQWERTVHGVTVGGVSTNVVYGTEMTFRAPEPWVDETCTTQIVYVGTSFTSPDVTNEFTVVVTNDVEFSWDVLATNYWLDVSATEGGSVDFDEGWISAGMRKVVSASAEFSYRFVRWEGDVTESQAVSAQTAVVMDRTRSLKAVFERIPITVGEAANAPDYDWYTEGDAEWVGEWSKSAADGMHAARSGTIANSQETVLGLRLEGAGTLSFDWRASCEEKYDAVRLEIDGSLVRVLSGETSWTNVCIELGLGEHDIRWVYKKGRSGSAGEDAVWVDNVVWTAAAEPTLAEALGDFAWETEGDVQWKVMRSEYAYEGNSFAMAEGLGAYGVSVIRTKVSGAGRLMFQWAVSCEESYDWFDFLVDGEVVEMVTGETNWRKVTVDLGEGEHILEWAYWKDEMDDPELVGANCAMLDHVQWYPAGEEPPELGGKELDEFFEWLKTHSQIAATATKQDAQAVFLVGTAAVGKAVPLYAEFLAGTDPKDPTSEFKATIEFKNGSPVVSPSPDLGGTRRYTVYGKKDIGDADEVWTPVGEGEEGKFNFFKVTVDMP